MLSYLWTLKEPNPEVYSEMHDKRLLDFLSNFISPLDLLYSDIVEAVFEKSIDFPSDIAEGCEDVTLRTGVFSNWFYFFCSNINIEYLYWK